MKCQVPTCNKKVTKEVHIIAKPNTGIFYFCEKHFKIEEKYWSKVYQMREIFDLTPKVDDRIKVQFT